MPELPEVEFARQRGTKVVDGRSIVRTEADPKARTFRGSEIKDVEALTGAITSITRKGKFLQNFSFPTACITTQHHQFLRQRQLL